jgi:hypothetical protein
MEVVTVSIRSGRKAATVDDLKRMLICLPRTDWPYGRVALCFPPSFIGTYEDLVQANFRGALEMCGQLEISLYMLQMSGASNF